MKKGMVIAAAVGAGVLAFVATGGSARAAAAATPTPPSRRRRGLQEGQPIPFDPREHPALSLPSSTASSSSAAPAFEIEIEEAELLPPAAPKAPAPAPAARPRAQPSKPLAKPAARPRPAPAPAERPMLPLSDAPPIVVTPMKPPAAPRPPPATSPAPSSSSAARAIVTRTPRQAALDLLSYVKPILSAGRGSTLGTKGNPNATVAAAQRDMGGIVADGIYGPGTRTRGKALSGQNFPARA